MPDYIMSDFNAYIEENYNSPTIKKKPATTAKSYPASNPTPDTKPTAQVVEKSVVFNNSDDVLLKFFLAVDNCGILVFRLYYESPVLLGKTFTAFSGFKITHQSTPELGNGIAYLWGGQIEERTKFCMMGLGNKSNAEKMKNKLLQALLEFRNSEAKTPITGSILAVNDYFEL